MARVPQRRNPRPHRARIPAMARQDPGRDPDVTPEELARASGVVRHPLFAPTGLLPHVMADPFAQGRSRRRRTARGRPATTRS